MKVLISGARYWSDGFMVDVIVSGLLGHAADGNEKLVILHGAARGADSLADTWRAAVGVEVVPFRAAWETHGRAAGAIRNRQMLDEKPDLVVAFHDDLAMSKGTRDCVNEAERRGIPTWHIRHVGVRPDAVGLHA